jgi:hypothetical protein
VVREWAPNPHLALAPARFSLGEPTISRKVGLAEQFWLQRWDRVLILNHIGEVQASEPRLGLKSQAFICLV